jgi:hypothetical protein
LNFGTINPCECSCKTISTTGTVTPSTCNSGDESFGQIIFNADPNSEVLITCNIPTALVNGGNNVPLSNMTAAYSIAGVSGTFTPFDPLIGITVTTGSTGDVIVRFGGKICPMKNIPGGQYNGTLLMTWKYTGSESPMNESEMLCITANIVGEQCCVAPPSKMVAWWSLDETSGANSYDREDFPNNGTQVNSPTTVSGKVAGALSFNGNDQYVQVADHNELDLGTGDFSIDTWIKTSDSNSVRVFLDKRETLPNIRGYELFLYDGVFHLQMSDGNNTNYGSGVFVADNQWHHLTVTVDRDDSTGVRFYVDGTPANTGNALLRSGSLSNSSALSLGSDVVGDGTPFNGVLDEVEIFKRVLTPDEVLSLYLADSLGKCKRDILDDTYNISLNPKWNMVSVPVLASDPTTTTLFPGAASTAFTFNDGYFASPTLDNSHGYWLKYANATTVGVTGTPILSNSYPLNAGWNMIAAIGASVDVSSPSEVSAMTMPEGIISSNFFGYENGYSIAASLEPGKGYWVKADEAGTIMLDASVNLGKSGAINTTQTHLSHLNKLAFADAEKNQQALYFGRKPEKQLNEKLFALPPVPPQGVFDVRFTSHQMVELFDELSNEGKELSINLSSVEFPLTVSFEVPHGMREKITVTALSDGKIVKKYTVNSQKKITIENPTVTQLVVKTSSSELLPKEFSLYQCYPNPFNPSTTIDFDIPSSSIVTLKVYDVIGREVTTVINQQQYEPGKYQTVFDAGDFASGLYFYRISMQGNNGSTFTDVKKMLLLR